MFPTQSMGYDRAITVFSPEGRLYQVEYASEAVRQGPLAVGVKAKDGVVLVGEKRSPNKLVDLSTLKKILLIDDHVGTAIAGLHADARKLIDQARVRSQINRLSYDEPITIQSLVVDVCDTKQMHTQYGGLRPFGASLIIGGMNEEPELFVTDPSGGYLGWKAASIGSGRTSAQDVFEAEYKDDITLEDSILLALKALKPSVEALVKGNIEMALIKEKTFRKMSDDEVKKYIDQLRE